MGKLRLPWDPASLRMPNHCLTPVGPSVTGSLVLIQSGGSDDTELRYSSQYEERLDPFSSFSKRVREPRARCGGAWRTTSSPGLILHYALMPSALVCCLRPSLALLSANCPPHTPPDHRGSLYARWGAVEARGAARAGRGSQEYLMAT